MENQSLLLAKVDEKLHAVNMNLHPHLQSVLHRVWQAATCRAEFPTQVSYQRFIELMPTKLLARQDQLADFLTRSVMMWEEERKKLLQQKEGPV